MSFKKYNLKNANHDRGFTLIELAVVIVIIALIAGGLTTGASLIKGAERRRVVADVAKYTSAVESFVTKYESLPGDMYNATDVWGEAHATPSTCETTIGSPATTTCNGNGDNQIGPTGDGYEMFRAWQHLANASFIEGRFTGVSTSSSDDDRASITEGTANVPEGKIARSGFTLRYIGTGSAPYFTNNDYGHIISFGAPTTNTITDGAILSAEDAWSIDNKSDDGRPGLGKIRSYISTSRPNCADSTDGNAAEYDVESSGNNCNLVFITGF